MPSTTVVESAGKEEIITALIVSSGGLCICSGVGCAFVLRIICETSTARLCCAVGIVHPHTRVAPTFPPVSLATAGVKTMRHLSP